MRNYEILFLLSTLTLWTQIQSLPTSKEIKKSTYRTTKNDVILYSSATSVEEILPAYEYQTIKDGKIAVVPGFLDENEVKILRADAQNLWSSNYFSTDALASYGTSGKFDPSKDRAVLRLSRWKNTAIGNWQARKAFGDKLARLRTALAVNLNRPRLDTGHSVKDFGGGSTEISYTRFGPGAYLNRHIDEHHEELKGKDGWKKPTRRSVTWLIYLNADWDAKKHGGELRVFERKSKAVAEVGARSNGDLQIGWLRASSSDRVERPVFLDGHCISENGKEGNCAMYIDDPPSNGNIKYITKPFYANPVLFVAGSEQLTQKILITCPDLKERFHYLEAPKSAIDGLFTKTPDGTGSKEGRDEIPRDISPYGGTLVVFDSVSVPHEVLATRERERFACSGWFHEDQQNVPDHLIS